MVISKGGLLFLSVFSAVLLGHSTLAWSASVRESVESCFGKQFPEAQRMRACDLLILNAPSLNTKKMAMVYVTRAGIHLNAGRFKAGEVDLNEALTLNPEDKVALRNRAILFQKLKRYDDSIRDFSRLIEINPDIVDGYKNRARVFLLKGDMQAALKDYNSTLKIAPNDPELWSNRAKFFVILGDMKRAADDFKRAVELDPDNAEILLDFAMNLLLLPANLGRDVEMATKLVKSALKSKETSRGYHILAMSHGDAKRYEEAIRNQENAISLAQSEGQSEGELKSLQLRLKTYRVQLMLEKHKARRKKLELD